jgi:hypothetical protein
MGYPRGGQLDGQGQAVQAAADFGGRDRVFIGQLVIGAGGMRALREQPYGIGIADRVGRISLGDCQWSHSDDMLAGEPQDDPARHPCLHSGAVGEESSDLRRRLDDLLEVIEY